MKEYTVSVYRPRHRGDFFENWKWQVNGPGLSWEWRNTGYAYTAKGAARKAERYIKRLNSSREVYEWTVRAREER